tara:strand:- start:2708 stop:2995 length:288 start_codon:yes stop_codon:yes gene_type:complete
MDETFYILTMNTEHFQWMTVGKTKSECRKLLYKRWKLHMKDRNGLVAKYVRDDSDKTPVDEYYGAWIQKVKIGGAYLDDEDETLPKSYWEDDYFD